MAKLKRRFSEIPGKMKAKFKKVPGKLKQAANEVSKIPSKIEQRVESSDVIHDDIKEPLKFGLGAMVTPLTDTASVGLAVSSSPVESAKAVGNAIADPVGTGKDIIDGVKERWNSGSTGKGGVVSEAILIATGSKLVVNAVKEGVETSGAGVVREGLKKNADNSLMEVVENSKGSKVHVSNSPISQDDFKHLVDDDTVIISGTHGRSDGLLDGTDAKQFLDEDKLAFPNNKVLNAWDMSYSEIVQYISKSAKDVICAWCYSKDAPQVKDAVKQIQKKTDKTD